MQRKTLWISLLSVLVLGALITFVYLFTQRPADTPTNINTDPTPAAETEPSTKTRDLGRGNFVD